jgi:hypothetical protein
VACEAGKAAAASAAKYCEFCAAGFHSTPGQPSCALCEAGYYWGVSAAGGGAYSFGCVVCPDNAVCIAGVNEGDQFQPIAKVIATQALTMNRKLVVDSASLILYFHRS